LVSSLAAVATTTAFDTTCNHTLERRGLKDRCPTGQHAVRKPGGKPSLVNGCGVGPLAGNLPLEKYFHECCNAHRMMDAMVCTRLSLPELKSVRSGADICPLF
jgi:hypothetical protein